MRVLENKIRKNMTKEFYLIDKYRLKNCHALMLAFNLWNETVHRGIPLEDLKILDLVKQIRAGTMSIIRTCQNHPGYVPWRAVKKGRKRENCETREGKVCHKRVRCSD